MEKISMIKSTLVLGIVCIIAAALLGFSYIITAEKISAQSELTLKENLKQVFPDADDFADKGVYFEAIKSGEKIGYAKIAQSQGYSSVIKIIIGIDLENKITGVRVIDQEETPGLGANSIKPDFYSQFDSLTLDEIDLRKNGGKIDSITGATITTKAVIDGVKSALEEEVVTEAPEETTINIDTQEEISE